MEDFMKNKFIRLFAFLCFAFTFVFMSCNQVIPEDNHKDISGLPNANVIITLQPEAERTISPVNGISYKEVSPWTVTFKETSGNGYDDIVKELSNREPTISVTIPVGSFDVILEGVTEKNTVKYYGKASFTVTGDETESISVPVTVSPKKTEGGTGSFTYTLTVQDYPSPAELTSVLIPYDTSKENITLTTTETDSANHVFTITGTNIPSGFYKFSVNLTADEITKDVFKSFDNLVEIIDDTETSDTKTINYVYEGEKSYYVTKSKDAAIGNGVFASMPIYYDDVLSKNDTVATVNMNFVDIAATDTEYPQIDVSKLHNKTYILLNNNNDTIYTITKSTENGIELSSNTLNTISLIDSTKTTADSNTVVNITNGRSIKLSLGGGVTVKTSEVAEIDIIENEYNESYSITNQPLLIVPSSAKVTLNSNKPTEGFELLGKTDNEGNMNYYFVKVGSAGISIIEATVPDFSIVDATDSILSSEKTYYIGDTVTLKAKPDGDFIYDEGTTFMWYVNGKEQDSSTTDTFELTFGKGDTAENNKIMCIACASGEYKSFVSEIIPIDRVALLYDTCSNGNTRVSFARISDLHTTTTSAGDIQKGDNINVVIDCFIDSDQKVYTLYTNNGSNYYSESSFNGTGYDSVEYSFNLPDYTPLQIKKGLDGNIYLLFKNNNGSTYEIKRVEADSYRNITFNNTSVEAFAGSDRTTFFVDESSNVYYIKETTETVTEGEIQTTKKSVKLMKNSSGTEVQVGAEIMSFTLGQPGGSIAGKNPSNLFINDDPEFTDMRIIDDKLYLLIRHLNSVTGYSYSTGCIIIIDMTNNKTSVVGWDNNTYIKDTDSYTHDSNTFYGPDKIVAIKPKKIVIADDGVEHGSGYNAKQKQRFVVFDLETNTITDLIETPEGINFSDGTTGSFFY